ncbi:MAG: excisionase family DNA binding protein [Rhodococcus sp. (in: high G+C Gram-positive bacteria)]|jgi:excisionase family DNA binding protein
MPIKTNTTERPDWQSVAQAAQRIGMSTDTIRKYIADGQLPAYRLGASSRSAIRIKTADVDALLRPIMP